jgi:hypothetical protein
MASYRVNVAMTRGVSAEPEPGDAPASSAPAGNTGAAYDAFWKPLEPALGNAKRVYVAPDGVLNQVPIGLLADSGGKLLLEKYELRYVNSTKDLLRPKHAAASKTAVLLGNPKFDLTEAEQRAALTKLGMAVLRLPLLLLPWSNLDKPRRRYTAVHSILFPARRWKWTRSTSC